MASWDFELAPAPEQDRARELWLQHAAGFILFEDVRRVAADKIDPALEPKAKSAALKAIDDAVYGLMQVIDGVSGNLRSGDGGVSLGVSVRLQRGGQTVQVLDLADGDGFCMGFHGWVQGDFGKYPVARARPKLRVAEQATRTRDAGKKKRPSRRR